MQVVQHNLLAQFSNRQLNITTGQKAKSTEKLSSGYRINRAADDAAGLSISEKMRWQIRGLDKAGNNIQDGISFVQTAEGALNEVHSMLSRMKELCVQAANDSNTDQDRAAIQQELDAIKKENERIFNDTTFNTIPVFRHKLNYVEYEDRTQQVVIGTGIEYPEGNNYGLVSVMNANGNQNITTSDHLADRVTFSGTGWVSSGNSTPRKDEYAAFYFNKRWHEDSIQHISTLNGDDIYTTDFSNVADGGTWTHDGVTFTRNGNKLYATSAPASGDIYENKDGETVPVADAYKTHEITLKSGTSFAEEYTELVIEKASNDVLRIQHSSAFDESGGGGSFRKNGTYACAYMDFSKLGTDFHKEDLYNLGFSSTCSHGCKTHYSVQFVDNSDGSLNLNKTTSNGLNYAEKNGKSQMIQIDISSISDDAAGGAKLVAAIVDAATKSESFDGHWEQYAYNTSEPAKLYLYENTLNVRSGERSTWEPAARDENGKTTVLEYTSGTKKYMEEEDLHIQSSSLAYQAIMIQRPVMTNTDLGIESVYVDDFQTATESVALVDSAIDYVSGKRAYLGATQNRLEHAYAVDANTSENTSAAESRLRDTDMAKEMVTFSKHSILEQAGQAMLTQANQQTQGIMALLQ